MEVIDSTVMEQVISAMDTYDYDKYTESDVLRAIAKDNRTPEDFAALLSPAALPHLEEMAQAAQQEFICSRPFISRTTAKIIVFTADSTAITGSGAPS